MINYKKYVVTTILKRKGKKNLLETYYCFSMDSTSTTKKDLTETNSILVRKVARQ